MSDLPPELEDALEGRWGITLPAVTFEAVLVLAAGFLGWIWGISPLQRTAGVENLSVDARAMGWGVLATLPLLGLLALIRTLPLAPFRRMNALVDQQVAPWFANAGVAGLAAISLAAGVGEELLFRGVLLNKGELWWGPVGAVLATSVLFGVAHWLTPTYALVTGGVGAYLAWLTIWLDNLFAAIVAHALYDFLALLYIAVVLVPASAPSDPDSGPSDDVDQSER